MSDVIIRKIDVHYSNYSKEVNWLIFESGDIQHPLLCLSDLQMKDIISQYEAIEHKETKE